jgi:hypothetical protein
MDEVRAVILDYAIIRAEYANATLNNKGGRTTREGPVVEGVGHYGPRT